MNQAVIQEANSKINAAYSSAVTTQAQCDDAIAYLTAHGGHAETIQALQDLKAGVEAAKEKLHCHLVTYYEVQHLV